MFIKITVGEVKLHISKEDFMTDCIPVDRGSIINQISNNDTMYIKTVERLLEKCAKINNNITTKKY